MSSEAATGTASRADRAPEHRPSPDLAARAGSWRDRTAAWAGRADLLPPRGPARRGLWWALGTFAGVRVALILSGGGFSTMLIDKTWQLLDMKYLQADVVRSVLALHIQPPLFNLFIGGVYGWSPLPPALTMSIAYTFCGAVIVGGLYLLLLDLRFGPVAAAVGAALVALNSSILSYEIVVAYEVPVIAMLVCAALFLVRWVRTGRMGWLIALAAMLATIVLTRALLHPVWMAAVLALALVARPPTRRFWPAVAVVVLAFTPILGWMLKNQILIGDATLSSWFGMNLSKSTVATLPLRDVDDLIAQGKLSPDARVPPFARLPSYQGREPDCRQRHHSFVLAKGYTHLGRPNYNAYCYLALYHQAQDDAIAAFGARPGHFVATRKTSFLLHFTDARALGSSGTPVIRTLQTVSRVVLVEPVIHPPYRQFDLVLVPRQAYFSFGLLAGTVLVLVRGVSSLRGVRRREPWAAAWVFIGGTTAFVFATSMLFEFGENGRFGLLVLPFVVSVIGATVAAGIETLIRRRRRAGPAADGEPRGPDGPDRPDVDGVAPAARFAPSSPGPGTGGSRPN